MQQKTVFRIKKIGKETVSYFFLILFAVFFLFPVFVMLMKSFMTDEEVLFFPKFFPDGLYFGAYARAMNLKMLYYLRNTVILIVLNLIGIPLSSSLCAYGFAKMKFKGREFCFMLVLSTLMLPSIAMQIPLYILYSKMGFIGTWWPMILPGFFGGGAINIFLMRQFMKGIPNAISEAARIDGANSFQIFCRLILPLCKSILMYVMVTTFLGVWNDFMTPLMYLGTKESMYTLSLGMYYTYKAALGQENLPNVQMAAGMMMLLPCMIIFFLFQNSLINGVTMGSVKG